MDKLIGHFSVMINLGTPPIKARDVGVPKPVITARLAVPAAPVLAGLRLGIRSPRRFRRDGNRDVGDDGLVAHTNVSGEEDELRASRSGGCQHTPENQDCTRHAHAASFHVSEVALGATIASCALADHGSCLRKRPRRRVGETRGERGVLYRALTGDPSIQTKSLFGALLSNAA